MISIIMSTYNGSRFLEEQINSILLQEETAWKLYIFDDGSKDGTEELLRTFEKEHPSKIRFIKNERNYGAKGNFFQGLRWVMENEEEPSDYFSFADQDDVWDRDKLSKSLKKMKEIEGREGLPAAVFSDVRLTDSELHLLAPSYFKASGLKKDELHFSSLLMENKAIGGTLLINSSLARLQWKAENREGGYPKRAKMHDWWFALMAVSLGRVGFLSEATESYRQHGGNVVGGEGFFNYVRARLSSLGEIRGRLRENMLQGEAFLSYFAEELSEDNKAILRDFISLKNGGFFRKRWLIVKRGFYKSGFVRNLALFLFI